MKTQVKDTKTGKIVSVEDPEKFIKHRKMGATILKDGVIQEATEVEEVIEVEEEEEVEEIIEEEEADEASD
jgi:hypothetical protein